MAVGFVGKGLGFMAAVVPLGVVTPTAFFAAGETFRLTSETGETLKTETGDFIARHFNSLATEAGDLIVAEAGELLEV